MLNRSNKSTIAGYFIAIYNALIMFDVDTLDYTLPSTWLKLIGAIALPIAMGHTTEVKKKD